MEHFAHPDLKHLLQQVLRVLRLGGRFPVAVPDASLYVDAYLRRSDAPDLLRYGPAVVSGQPMDVLNYIFYMDNQHRFMFDHDYLAHHCREVGFENCMLRAFDPEVDLEARDYKRLYMVCRKPVAA